MSTERTDERGKNLEQCAKDELWSNYFEAAEQHIDSQWETVIWPLVRDFDFSTVLELAPGGGRNTEKLCGVSKRLYAVDLNGYALEKTEKRLGREFQGCELSYHQNTGCSLPMLEDESVSAIYCFDSAVHFAASVIEDYVSEFARILKPGGKGFVHHSDLGEAANPDMKQNPHWRTKMSKEEFADFCEKSGLTLLRQEPIAWGEIQDCASLFQKPEA